MNMNAPEAAQVAFPGRCYQWREKTFFSSHCLADVYVMLTIGRF
jgi:hypothetical protein